MSSDEFAVGILVLDLLPAHVDITSAGRLFVALLGFVVAAPLLALGVIAGFLGLLLGRVLGGGEVEILEQPTRQLGKRSLVVERQRQCVELGRGLFLYPWRDQLEPRGSGSRRLLTGQPLAGDESDGGRQGHLLRAAGTDDRVASDPGFGELGGILLHSTHRPGAERLDPRHFQGIEHGPRLDVHWRVRA